MSTDAFFTLACSAFIGSLFGLVMAFAGYKLFRLILPIWGFFFGFLLGAQSIQIIFNEGFLATITSWVVGLIVGIIFAVLAFPFYLFGVAIIAASLGYIATVGLWLWIGLPYGFLMWLIAIIVATALTAVTLIFNIQKWVIIIATAILGASLSVGVIAALFQPISLLLENPVQVVIQTSPLLLILFLALVILGIIVQSRTTRSVAVVEPSPAVKSAAVPVTVASETAPAVAAVGAAGIAAVVEESKPEVGDVASVPTVPIISAEDVDKFKYGLEYIEGIGQVYTARLNAIGIMNLHDLLEKGAFPKGREEIATTAGISQTLVLKWVNHVDLFRIKGVGSEYADLLEVAGVDTVVELANRNPDNLFAKLASVNEEKKLVRKLPVFNQVQDWIEQAKSLPRKINY